MNKTHYYRIRDDIKRKLITQVGKLLEEELNRNNNRKYNIYRASNRIIDCWRRLKYKYRNITDIQKDTGLPLNSLENLKIRTVRKI